MNVGRCFVILNQGQFMLFKSSVSFIKFISFFLRCCLKIFMHSNLSLFLLILFFCAKGFYRLFYTTNNGISSVSNLKSNNTTNSSVVVISEKFNNVFFDVATSLFQLVCWHCQGFIFLYFTLKGYSFKTILPLFLFCSKLSKR